MGAKKDNWMNGHSSSLLPPKRFRISTDIPTTYSLILQSQISSYLWKGLIVEMLEWEDSNIHADYKAIDVV